MFSLFAEVYLVAMQPREPSYVSSKSKQHASFRQGFQRMIRAGQDKNRNCYRACAQQQLARLSGIHHLAAPVHHRCPGQRPDDE